MHGQNPSCLDAVRLCCQRLTNHRATLLDIYLPICIYQWSMHSNNIVGLLFIAWAKKKKKKVSDPKEHNAIQNFKEGVPFRNGILNKPSSCIRAELIIKTLPINGCLQFVQITHAYRSHISALRAIRMSEANWIIVLVVVNYHVLWQKIPISFHVWLTIFSFFLYCNVLWKPIKYLSFPPSLATNDLQAKCRLNGGKYSARQILPVTKLFRD